MGEFVEKSAPSRYASADEIRGYLDHHADKFKDLINGVETVEFAEDEEGLPFMLFTMKHLPNDPRELTLQEVTNSMQWVTEGVLVRPRIITFDTTILM